MGWHRRRRSRDTGPLVAPEVVQEYLDRPLDDFTWMKKVPRKELIAGLNGFDFRIAPYHHQLVCFNIGIEIPAFLFFVSMGGGKSKLVLDLIRWKREHEGLGRVLIMVLKEVNMQTWMEQVAEHAPELTCVPILGSTKERRELIEQPSDIALLNYPCLQLLMSELVPIGKGKKRKREIVPDLAKRIAEMFGMVVFDESHRFLGHHTSLSYRMCRYFTKHSQYLYALTGTPFGRDPMLLWSQFHVVDNGESLGERLGLFRTSFFHAKENYWGGIDYTFDKKMQPELHRLVQHRSISYADEEFFDAPACTRQVIKVSFGTTAEQQYQNVLKSLKESRGGYKELQNVFTRTRMCTSGFLSLKSDLQAERLQIKFDDNPKMDALEGLVLGIDAECKAIIYHFFIATGKMIGEMLDKHKLPYAAVSGQVKDQIGQINKFLHDPECRFLVANYESGSEGINPQHVCNYVIFYESPVSPSTRKQAEKRVIRPGQKRHVYIYDLVVPKSVDEKILAFLKEGKDLFEAIVKGKGIQLLLGANNVRRKVKTKAKTSAESTATLAQH